MKEDLTQEAHGEGVAPEGVVTLPEGGSAAGAGKRRRPWSVFGLGVAPDEGKGPAAVKFEVKLLDECGAMLRYASTRGMEIPPRAAYTVRELDNKRMEQGKKWSPAPQDAADLAAAHGHLSRLVDPATPKSITLVNEQSPHSRWVALFGAVLVVRVMMALAIVFLLAFLVLLPIVGDDPADAIASPSWGRGFLGAVYIVLAAGLGVLFSQLFLINRQISRGRYDPTEDAAQVTTIVLGLIAGIILAMLLPDVLDTSDAAVNFSPALLALLGGFSAPVVYGVVSRLVDAVGTLVGGDPKDQTATEVQEAVTRVKLALEQDRRRIAGRAFRVGDEAAGALRIDDPAKRDEAIQQLQAKIADMMNDLVPEIGPKHALPSPVGNGPKELQVNQRDVPPGGSPLT